MLGLTGTFLLFGPVLPHLNQSFLTLGGDGFKNYFNYLYFLKYDSGHHFTGMAYPFGEHIVFTDNMPFFAWTIAKLKVIFPGIANYALGIMHTAMVVSYPLAAWYLFMILKLYRINSLWAAMGAVLIAFFSPQVFRIPAHFGLSFACYIPMVLYWLMQSQRTGKWKYAAYVFVIAYIFSFIHVYNIGFALIATVFASVSYVLLAKDGLKEKLKRVLPMAMAAAMAVVCFKLTLNLTDTIKDRPRFPGGFLGACTTGEQILTSDLVPLGVAYQFLLGNQASGGGEGYVYVGFVSITVTLLLLSLVIVDLTKKKRKQPMYELPFADYKVWLLTAAFSLLLGMGVPFVWGLESLAEHLSWFRQLRSLGRFSWIFYYLYSVFVVIALYRGYTWLSHKGKRKIGYALLASSAGLWGWQAVWLDKGIGDYIKAANYNYQQYYRESAGWEAWLKEQGVQPRQYQAVMMLPFFHVGSDKLSLVPDVPYSLFTPLTQVALSTGLPIVDVLMSRTSWSQTFEIARLVDGAWAKKEVINKFDNRPILVMAQRNDAPPLLPEQERLLSLAKPLGTFDKVEVYSLNLRALAKSDSTQTAAAKAEAMKRTEKEGLLNGAGFLYTNHFDQEKAGKPMAGKGALGDLPNYTVIAEIKMPPADTLRHFNCAIWSLVDSVTDHLTVFILKQYDSTGKQIFESDMPTKFSTFVTNFWFLTQRIVEVQPHTAKITFISSGYSDKHNHYALDELVIWPAGTTYFYKPDAQNVWLDNRPIDR
ncbi:MAG: hypothetical protein QM642_11475 [Edaphocola sp.]